MTTIIITFRYGGKQFFYSVHHCSVIDPLGASAEIAVPWFLINRLRYYFF